MSSQKEPKARIAAAADAGELPPIAERGGRAWLDWFLTAIRLRKGRRLGEKALIGVHHSDDPDELKAVMKTLKALRPKTAALELPESYLQESGAGLRSPFFSELALNAKRYGCEIIPVDSGRLMANEDGIGYAISVVRKGGGLPDVVRERDEIKASMEAFGPRTDPIVVGPLLKRYDTLDKAALALQKTTTEAELAAMLAENRRIREEHMMEAIAETRPDVIVVGDGHARRMAERLPVYGYRGYDPATKKLVPNPPAAP